MGLFGFVSSVGSAISSGISAVGSAISSGISEAGTAIANTVSTLGTAVSNFVEKVAPVIASVVDALAPVAQALGNFASAFLQGLGIFRPGESVIDIGERALQAAAVQGITPDKFDDFQEYMAALRNFQLDPENKHTFSENLVAGLGVGSWALEKKYDAPAGSLASMWLWPMANPAYFTLARMDTLLRTGALTGGSVQAYLEKRLSGTDASSLRQKLETNPDGTSMHTEQRGELYTNLEQSRDNWAALMEKVQEIKAEEARKQGGEQ